MLVVVLAANWVVVRVDYWVVALVVEMAASMAASWVDEKVEH